MLKEKIQKVRSQITEKREGINAKIDDAQVKAEKGDLDQAKEIQLEIEKMKKELQELLKDLQDLEKLAGLKKEESPPEEIKEERIVKKFNTESKKEEHVAINTFIKSKGETRDGVKSTDVGVLIPEDIVYQPKKEVKSIVDLSKLVQKTKVKTASGKYPVLKRATTGFNTVEELEKNPELAKPEFINVNWEVKTFRGAVPISEESLADSAADLASIVANHIQEQKIVTTNKRISDVLKGFQAVSAKSVDDIKNIFNVQLDPGYERVIVASQSFLQAVDTLKDKNDQYILHQDITSASGRTLLGVPIQVVGDDLLGQPGEAHAFIGDLKRAVLYADRADLAVRWEDNNIYGRILMGVFRFDVKAADPNAGFFVTYGGATPKK